MSQIDISAIEDEIARQAFFIVAIGSSAGGLEALRSLFQHLPVNHGFTYVVAQHLAPQHSSMLTDLLARETLLKVSQLDDDVLMEPGVIYITAPNHDVTYRDGWLRLQPPSARGPKPSVDTLLVSLADEVPKRTIGVILSGSGSDGAAGVRQLKAAGGVVLAQDPQLAKYASMPQSAIATGCVDRVLPAEHIGPFIQKLRESDAQLVLETGPRRRVTQIDKVLEKVMIATNVDFRGYKINTLTRRINQRMVATDCATIQDYLVLLDNSHEEIRMLAHNCLVSVTSFFRESSYFDSLANIIRQRVIPDVQDPFRVWVPGCATGEEAYSLAILLTDLLPLRRVQIFGTDLDEQAIAYARRAWYPAHQVRSIPDNYLRTYMIESADGNQIERRIRDRVVFARHDLLRDPLFLNLDLISCRNLLIYFKPAVQVEVMRKFHQALKTGGLLFVGRSENADGEMFDAADRRARIYINKPMLESDRRWTGGRDWGVWESPAPRGEQASQPELAPLPSLLVDYFAPPSVIVDESFRIVESHGNIGRFLRLQPGKPQFTLLGMVPKAIMGSLRAQLQRCIRSSALSKGIPRRMEVEGKEVQLQLNVYPVERGQAKLYMVCFIESEVRPQSSLVVHPDSEEQIRELERELASTRESLQAVVEELETSNEELQALNEELQSSNEELQASNEELQSSNEELQSTNEELLTVNEELEHKSIELCFSIEDLENIQNSLEAALFITDARGHFRHINEDARRLFHLTQEHVNGPLTIPTEPALTVRVAATIQKVLADSKQSEFATTIDGRSFRVRVQPYVGMHKVTKGALIVFQDVTHYVQVEDRLRRSEARLMLLSSRQEATLNALSAQVAMLDGRGTIMAVNNTWKDFSRASSHTERRHGVGSSYLEVCRRFFNFDPATARELSEAITEVISGTRQSAILKYHCTVGEQQHWFEIILTGIRDSKSRGAVAMHQDITDLMQMSEKISLQVAALQSTANAIFIADINGRVDWVNAAFETITGFSSEDVAGQSPKVISPPGMGDGFESIFRQVQATGRPWKGEQDLIRKNGELLTIRLTVTPILSAAGEMSHFIVTFEDTTDYKRAQAQMLFLAEHDQLTNLWNRKSFVRFLENAIVANTAANGRIAVMFLDLDRFKDTNDTLGHLVGDRMLIEIAQRLRSNIEAPDNLARFGGDEFVLYLENADDKERIDHAVNRLLHSFTRPIEVDGRSIYVTASVGITIFPDDGTTAEVLLRNADLAMYRAKAEGRRGYRYYDQMLEAEINERVSIEGDLARAIARKDLWIAFQPQVDLRTNEVVGAESLLRWKTGTDRNVPISRAIAIAEESGLILSIGEWVMRESIQQLKQWKLGGQNLRISVNLSAVQFHQQDVFGMVMQLLRQYDLPPSSLKVEITETVLLNRSARVRETLHALHGAGVGLVLDDFGTGYSSLTYLQEFPIESVKIDTSFLRGIGQNSNDEAIVRGIIRLAHSLGQRVVAEGVETQNQLDFLREFDCDFAQGFLFGHPLMAAEFDRKLGRAAGA